MKSNIGLLTCKTFHDSKHLGGTETQRNFMCIQFLELTYFASDRMNMISKSVSCLWFTTNNITKNCLTVPAFREITKSEWDEILSNN